MSTVGKKARKALLALAAITLPFLANTASSAELILTNPDFSSGSAGWNPVIISGYTGAGETGITFESGVVKLGRTGTPGEAQISQGFSVTGTQQVLLQFDYQWFSSNPPATDIFTVTLKDSSPPGNDQVAFSQLSGAGTFQPAHFQNIFTVNGDGTLVFYIKEFNNLVGTYVQIDNVSLTTVPLPAAAWLFGSALIGLVAVARRKATA